MGREDDPLALQSRVAPLQQRAHVPAAVRQPLAAGDGLEIGAIEQRLEPEPPESVGHVGGGLLAPGPLPTGELGGAEPGDMLADLAGLGFRLPGAGGCHDHEQQGSRQDRPGPCDPSNHRRSGDPRSGLQRRGRGRRPPRPRSTGATAPGLEKKSALPSPTRRGILWHVSSRYGSLSLHGVWTVSRGHMAEGVRPCAGPDRTLGRCREGPRTGPITCTGRTSRPRSRVTVLNTTRCTTGTICTLASSGSCPRSRVRSTAITTAASVTLGYRHSEQLAWPEQHEVLPGLPLRPGRLLSRNRMRDRPSVGSAVRTDVQACQAFRSAQRTLRRVTSPGRLRSRPPPSGRSLPTTPPRPRSGRGGVFYRPCLLPKLPRDLVIRVDRMQDLVDLDPFVLRVGLGDVAWAENEEGQGRPDSLRGRRRCRRAPRERPASTPSLGRQPGRPPRSSPLRRWIRGRVRASSPRGGGDSTPSRLSNPVPAAPSTRPMQSSGQLAGDDAPVDLDLAEVGDDVHALPPLDASDRHRGRPEDLVGR